MAHDPDAAVTTRRRTAAAKVEQDQYVADTFTFGWGEDGRLGLGRVQPKCHPKPHPVFALHWRGRPSARVKQAACGGKHTLFLLEDGRVWWCGVHGSSPTACWTTERIEGFKAYDEPIRKVRAGHMTSFAVSDAGDVWAWGSNRFGALGNGHSNECGGSEPSLMPSLNNIPIAEVSTMGWHVLALAQDRRLFAWGSNGQGQCGIGKTCRSVNTPTQVDFSRHEKVLAVAAGWEHSIALVEVERNVKKREVVVYAWGNPGNHRLGGVDVKRHFRPQENQKLTAYQLKKRCEIRLIAAGGMHNLVTTNMGMVLSWGCGSYGQLGSTHLRDMQTPVKVLDVARVKQLAAGYRHSLVLTEDHEVYAWGWNTFGELGTGDVDVKLQPYCLLAFKGVHITGVYTGERHTVVTTSGTVRRALHDKDYKPYFDVYARTGPTVTQKENLRMAMKVEGLNPDFLDHKEALVPGQPGMADEDVDFDASKYGLKWCLETCGKDVFIQKSSWPSRYVCRRCNMRQVCMACARRCHRGHGLDVYMSVKRAGDKCDCMTSKTCICRWSRLRHIFGKYASRRAEFILGSQLQSVLEEARSGATLTVEDLEACYTSLCCLEDSSDGDLMQAISQAKVEWPAFEEFFNDYFSAKDAPVPGATDTSMR